MTPEAKLIIDNNTYNFPVITGSMGNRVIDFSSLGPTTGLFTIDPGLKSSGSCFSEISYIDGAKGKLYYRGYPIDELTEKKSYLDVAYLLLNGELPTQEQSVSFQQEITELMPLSSSLKKTTEAYLPNSHPMAMLLGFIGALAGENSSNLGIADEKGRHLAYRQIIAKMPAMAAASYRHKKGLPLIEPRSDYTYAENFLHMMFSQTPEDKPNPLFTQAMDVIFSLHADHGQNASTSAVRVSASTGTNIYSSMTSGISSLWGPAHGGANEACIRMLKEIGSVDNIPMYLEKAKDKNDPFRLMGFGHRVYKNYDPRAKLIEKLCHSVLTQTRPDPLFDLAAKLEEIARSDQYFIDRNLYPNVDFYSGIILQAIGFPAEMFTVIFALGRTSGWLSHIEELISKHPHPITRPRQCYVGHTERHLETT